MSDPKDKFPIQHSTGDKDIDTAAQDLITNSEESDKVVNQDSAVADTDGITETLSESDPSTALNADRDVTNSEAGSSENPPVVN